MRKRGQRSGVAALLFAVLTVPIVALLQPLLGVLVLTNPNQSEDFHATLLAGLKDLGYEVGRDLRVERCFAYGDNARFPALARELLAQKPAVVLTPCGPAQRAIREINRAIPLVSICADEKNFLGEVASFRRPGGATTGITFLAPESASKRLEILKEIHPNLKRVAFLYHSGDDWDNYWREIERASPRLGISILRLPVKNAGDLEGAFSTALSERADALVVFPDATTSGVAERIAQFALTHRLATAFDFPLFPAAGGLFSYGADMRDVFRRVAPRYIDRIVKGAKPGDLPIEQPTKFLLVINLKTAKALGLTISQSLRLRADRVIE
jgi:putative ABC transport system substrate-binding protein